MFPPTFLPFLIPIMALLIPIVAILASHQQKMARILHEGRPAGDPEIAQLRNEIRELKELVHSQALQLDNIIAPRLAERNDDMSQRL